LKYILFNHTNFADITFAQISKENLNKCSLIIMVSLSLNKKVDLKKNFLEGENLSQFGFLHYFLRLG
jgi:hypothetical protein